jgi:hypothetical protein
MVRFIRCAEPRFEKLPQCIAYAKKISAYIKKAHRIEAKVFANSRGVIYWIVDYKNYADLEKSMKKVNSDKKYWQMVSTAKDIFLQGTLSDEIISSVD